MVHVRSLRWLEAALPGFRAATRHWMFITGSAAELSLSYLLLRTLITQQTI